MRAGKRVFAVGFCPLFLARGNNEVMTNDVRFAVALVVSGLLRGNKQQAVI